jgi:ABC-type Fe3+-hydroxamate transport system substrate-binding protein
MVTSGLVPELTGEAARLASLGAGAKVVGVYAFQLTEDDLEDIAALKPDIFLYWAFQRSFVVRGILNRHIKIMRL